MNKFKLALLTVALTASSLTWAQDGKAALVKQLLDLQRPGIEVLARNLVMQSSDPIAAAGSDYLRTQVPADKREAAAKAADAELKKYYDDSYPIVRDKALQLAPGTVGPLLEQNFSEDELKQVIAWLGSPVARKYEQFNPQLGNALVQKLVPEVQPTIKPKIEALNVAVAKALGAPLSGDAPSKPAAPAKAPAKK